MSAQHTKPIAEAIRDHQLLVSVQWKYHGMITELHQWAERFNTDFDLGLPTPVIQIDNLPYNVFGYYQLGYSPLGTRTTIFLNARRLPKNSGPDVEAIDTLIHELLHAYEEWRLGREKGGSYHTIAWREMMAKVGIIADKRGHNLKRLPEFYDYLRRYGFIETLEEPTAAIVAPEKRRQLPKWVCGCPSGKPARAVVLNALCLDCNQHYVRSCQ